MEYVVAPKLIRRKNKTILVTCGGKDCGKVTQVIYSWNNKGKDRLICMKCGKENHFEIPE